MLNRCKKTIISLLAIFVLLGTTIGCEEEDYEVVEKSIRSIVAFGMTEVFSKNIDLIAPVCQVAKVNRERIITGEINELEASNAMDLVLEQLKGLDEEEKQTIKQIWATVMPLINMSGDGILKDPQRRFVLAFYNGILDACKLERDLCEPATYHI